LNGSPHDVVNQLKQKYNLSFAFYFTDVTTLKTMIRSNPGLVLLKEGIVLTKWHFKDIPEFNSREPLLATVLTTNFSKIEGNRVMIIGLGFMVIVLILWFLKKKN
jgi:hypothetical protein